MITQNQIDSIIKTMKPYDPTKIGIFGSYARSENTEKSDIDILYSFENTIGLFKLVEIKNKLEEQLHHKVDLVAEKYTHPKLKSTIMNDLKIVYEK